MKTKRIKLIYLVVILLFLSLSDAILTDIGLKNNWIVEGNPIMNKIYFYNVVYFYLFKLVLPMCMIFLVFKIKATGIIGRLLAFSVVLYLEVIVLHINWISHII